MMANNVRWFVEAKVGMFIHWGLYSALGRGEWVMRSELIPVAEYAALADEFKPTGDVASGWARLAKKVGMKYMVFTTRHHDGFCLFDSGVSDFTSVKTAARRDFVAEYIAACRSEGLKVGLYYSLGDWRFGFPQVEGLTGSAEDAAAMRAQAHAQVRELLTNYGKIDILWYDGGWVYPSRPSDGDKEVAAFWGGDELNAMARGLQPDILINNRAGVPADFGTPEQKIVVDKDRVWECCMTIGSEHGWGYLRNDPSLKTAGQLVGALVMAACQGGNLLLNVGPDAAGRIPTGQMERLEELGDWLTANGGSIYGAKPCAISNHCIGIGCAVGARAFFHVLRWPGGSFVVVNNTGREIQNACIMKTGERLAATSMPHGRILLEGLPETPPDPLDTVVEFEFA